MPTFASVQLKNFLEPGVRDSLKKPVLIRDEEDPNPDPDQKNGRPRHLYVSPALYTTPEQAPITVSSSPDMLSPSPYVANQKRRRGGDETRRVGPGEIPELPSGSENEVGDFNLEDVVVDNFLNENLVGNDEVIENNDDDDEEGFLDPRSESMSVASEVEANDYVLGRQMESRSFVSAQGEFFDANDDFSSDGSISNTPSRASRTQSDLHFSRISILEEIERRTIAEETLTVMRNQWERISNLMCEAGFTFPAPPDGSDNMHLENNSIDQLSQEIVVTRFVSEAIGRGLGRAEAEQAASLIIESKDQEILRLKDRLQYYEAVNHQLSQRKLVEVARRQQERKRSRRRWIWSFMGLSVVIGASVVAYSYIPHTSNYLSSLKSSDLNDADCVSCSEIYSSTEC